MVVPLPPQDSIYWLQPWLCTYSTCPLDVFGQLEYRPSLGGNILYLAIFALGLLINIWLAIKYRTWGYLVAIIGGAGLEIVGYIGRIMLWQNDFDNNFFIIYIVGLTIGPAFFSAAVYLCLARIIAIYGHGLSWFTPRFITCSFIASDLVSLVLQAAGGALASLAETDSEAQLGINLMIAGLSTQVASMTAYVVVCCQLAWAIHKHPEKVSTHHAKLRSSRAFRFFLWSIGICTIAILIRCTFRVAELSKGFGGSIANNEILFMILDGMMMAIVIILFTVAHPGIILGEMWKAGGFRLRRSKTVKNKEEAGQVEEASGWGAGSHAKH